MCLNQGGWLHLHRDAAGSAGVPRRHRRVPTTPEDLDGEEDDVFIQTPQTLLTSRHERVRADRSHVTLQVLGVPSELSWPGVSQLPNYRPGRFTSCPSSQSQDSAEETGSDDETETFKCFSCSKIHINMLHLINRLIDD